MKKILFTLFIIFSIITNINYSYSFDENNIKTVESLINYINTKTEDLVKMQEKYDLVDDKDIKQRLNKLEEIKKILVKTSKTWEYNNYVLDLVEQLKFNNTLIKENLKIKIIEKKIEADKYKILYYQKINPVIDRINIIVKNIAKQLMKKEKLNLKDKQIIWILTLVKQRLDKLDNITNIDFKTKKDLIDYIVSNFKQVTNNFKQMKNIIKSTN